MTLSEWSHPLPRAPLSREERLGLPSWIKPQLAQLVKRASDGFGWLHEIIKLDGYRIHADLDRGGAKILT